MNEMTKAERNQPTSSILSAALAASLFSTTGMSANAAEPVQLKLFNDVVKSVESGELDNAKEKAKEISDPDLRSKAAGLVNDEAAKKFWSVWGVGLAVNHYDKGHSRVIAGSVVNNVVQVERGDSTKYGLGLEVHRYVFGTTWGTTGINSWAGGFALGPYVSVLPGSDNTVIDLVGTGLSVGFIGGRSGTDGTKFSMNLALGRFIDPGERALANGFVEGSAPPNGESTVRYATVTRYGKQGVVSFSYDF